MHKHSTQKKDSDSETVIYMKEVPKYRTFYVHSPDEDNGATPPLAYPQAVLAIYMNKLTGAQQLCWWSYKDPNTSKSSVTTRKAM